MILFSKALLQYYLGAIVFGLLVGFHVSLQMFIFEIKGSLIYWTANWELKLTSTLVAPALLVALSHINNASYSTSLLDA